MKARLLRFMQGRYGTDKLNNLILGIGLFFCVASLFVGGTARLVMTTVSYVFMILVIFRCFSRNTYKRYQENRKYLFLVQRLRDRKHRYYACPRCHQPVRVPRGKGKIAIHCPKCKETFTKKT